MQLSIDRNLILEGCLDDIPTSGLLVLDAVGWQSMYFCCNAQSKSHSDPRDICMLSLFYQLPNCNLFTEYVVIYLLKDITSELWTPVQFPLHCYYCLLLLALFTFLHTTIAFHSIHSILCLQQTSEIDNIIVSWEQSSWLCCVQVPCCCWCKAKPWTRRLINCPELSLS
jgi:hypothetical protein